MKLRLITIIAPLALIAACSDNSADDEGMEQTPNDESVSNNGSTQEIDKSPRAIEAARTRAAELVGGPGELVNPPEAKRLADNASATTAMVAAARTAVKPGGANCGEKVDYSSAWTAKLPPAFPVYPRGVTQEAAGTDEGDCALRIVSFETPVALEEVLAFYHTRAKAAGFGVEHVRTAGDNILSGTKGDSAYVVYGRRLPSGLTEIDLVTSN